MPIHVNLYSRAALPWHVFEKKAVVIPKTRDIALRRFFDILGSGVASTALNPANKNDCELLTGDRLGMYPHLLKEYKRIYGPFLIELYEMVLSGERTRMPNHIYDGFQGLMNAIILFRYVLEVKCELKMDENGRKIDPRLFSKYQKDFLSSVLIGETRINWDVFLQEHKLLTAIHQAKQVESSIVGFFRCAYPWAFNSGTPEGHHLHPWDFSSRDMWQSDGRVALAKEAIRHVFGKHLGFTMDMEQRIIDQRFFPGKWKEFLFSQGVEETQDLLEELGISGVIHGCPEFKGKYVDLLIATWPWAFDLKAPEGKHLHYWDFFGKGIREQTREMALQRCRHVLERHLGLKMDRERMIIDERLGTKGAKEFLKACGHDSWNELFQWEGFRGALIDSGAWEGLRNSAKAFREMYPWAFDLNKQVHLHFWRLHGEYPWTMDDIKLAVRHEFFEDGFAPSDIPAVLDREWLTAHNFLGVDDLFASKLDLIRFVFSDYFEKRVLDDTMFLSIKTDKGLDTPLRSIVDRAVFGRSQGSVFLKGKQYLFDPKLIGLAVRIVSSDFAMVYQASPLGAGRKFKALYLFPLYSGEKNHAWIEEGQFLTPNVNLAIPNPDGIIRLDRVLSELGKRSYQLPLALQVELTRLLEKGKIAVKKRLREHMKEASRKEN